MKGTKKQAWWYQMTNKLPLGRAWGMIALSVFFITGPIAFAVVYYHHLQSRRLQDSRYGIVAVIQTGLEKEQLNTRYLTELLDLSVNKPQHLYQFDAREGERRLLQSPLIKEALIKKVPPGILYIDYSIRKPVAYLMDFDNAAVDVEGVLIPFKPFFTPKRLPEIYLGVAGSGRTYQWGSNLCSPRLQLAFQVMAVFRELLGFKGLSLALIDTSCASEESCGRRQVVAVIQENDKGRMVKSTLRLSTERYRSEIARYGRIREKTLALAEEAGRSEVVVDLRMNQLAFIEVEK